MRTLRTRCRSAVRGAIIYYASLYYEQKGDLESEPAVMGCSAHLIVVGRKPLRI